MTMYYVKGNHIANVGRMVTDALKEKIMNKYEKMAKELERRFVANNGTVEVTPEEAIKIIQYLYGMCRIQKIIESEHGGAELF